VARHLEQAWGEEAGDIAEVLASHYLDAVAAEPDADDAETIRASACQTLEEAGKRAISLALGPEARRHFEHAAELAREPGLRGRLLHEAGSAATTSGELDEALELLQTAVEVLEGAGLARDAARVESAMGLVLIETGRTDDAVDLLARAYAALDDGSDDAAFAEWPPGTPGWPSPVVTESRRCASPMSRCRSPRACVWVPCSSARSPPRRS